MNVIENIKTRRSIRKFDGRNIELSLLKQIVDTARYAPAAANIQPLMFAVVNTKEKCNEIFPHTHWAKLLGERGTPKNGEEPTAYIIVMSNKEKRMNMEADAAFAVENMVLAAWNMGIGSCILGAINKAEIGKIVNIPQNYEINYAVALGYPAQQSVAEDAEDSVAYYMDDDDKVHVPKRKLDDVMYIVR